LPDFYTTFASGTSRSEEQPAFYHTYQYVRGTKLGVVKANQAILQKLETDSTAIILSPRSLPMVIPPRAWQSHSVGCYVIHQGGAFFEAVKLANG